jgi:hypothetical protein
MTWLMVGHISVAQFCADFAPMCPADFAIAMKRRHRLDRLRRRRQHPKVEHGRVEFGMSEQLTFAAAPPLIAGIDDEWRLATSISTLLQRVPTIAN